jgi:uncharacterized protein with NRDE domain
MCTIAVWFRVHPEVPLIVAANRDEFLDRKFRPPERLGVGNAGVIVAGVDELAGGTWMGATSGGFFAGLTNVRPPEGTDRRRRSRGELVVDVLRAGSSAADVLASRSPADYNPFYLLFGDAAGLRLAASPPGAKTIALHDVAAGFHVLPNGPLDDRAFPKVARVAELVPDPKLRVDTLIGVLGRMLGDHVLVGDQPLTPICVHTPIYGTSSSTVLLVGDGRVERYLFAAGTPCTTAFTDVTALLASGEGAREVGG